MRVLITGATGAVGASILRVLRRSHEVVGVSRRRTGQTLGWDLSRAIPDKLPKYDLVVHCAANTQWNQTPESAVVSNVRTVENLLDTIGTTPLIHLSTLYVAGSSGCISSNNIDAYRNAYEWSKAAAERMLWARPETTILRFPIVFGSRIDGRLDRYSGFFKLVAGITSGLVPAVVGSENAQLDIVSVDDVSSVVAGLIEAESRPRRVRIGRGADAASLGTIIDIALTSLNEFRDAKGVVPIARPPVLDPDRWQRFFLPLAREHLSALQLRAIDFYSEFEPYLSIHQPFEVDQVTPDELPVVDLTIRAWAQAHPRAALREPKPWS